jgi:hypothetical protein
MSEVIGHNRFGTLPFESYNHEDLQYGGEGQGL